MRETTIDRFTSVSTVPGESFVMKRRIEGLQKEK
jgi:hypothetical protein